MITFYNLREFDRQQNEDKNSASDVKAETKTEQNGSDDDDSTDYQNSLHSTNS